MSDFKVLSGPSVRSMDPVLFTANVAVSGFTMPQFAHVSSYNHLTMALYLSPDPMLSNGDHNLHYNSSACIHQIIQQGINDGDTLHIKDCQG